MESQSRKDAKLTVIDTHIEAIASEIVDVAFKVHNYFGPGLFESIYEKALCKELKKRDIKFISQYGVPVFYEEELLGNGFIADIVVEDKIVLELKACEKLLPIHKKQTLTYARLLNYPLGFLINFNNTLVKNGIVRIINDHYDSRAAGAINIEELRGMA